MLKKIFNLIFLNFKGYSLLRSYQIIECNNICLKGKTIEFGAYKNKEKNFSNFFKGNSLFKYSNIFDHRDKNYIKANLSKKIKIKKDTFNNVIIFNVFEHLHDTNNALKEVSKILKNRGNLIGSTPFIYQVHGAPNDYFRFTKDFYYKKLSKKFKNINVKPLGHGPFIASFSLLNPYLKFFPILKEIILLISFFLDSVIQIFVTTKLNEIYPIGYFFIIKK